MRAVCHLAVSPHISPLHKLCFFFVIVSFDSLAVFGQYISLSCSLSLFVFIYFFIVLHRWVLSCVSNLWLSESPVLHFLLLP